MPLNEAFPVVEAAVNRSIVRRINGWLKRRKLKGKVSGVGPFIALEMLPGRKGEVPRIPEDFARIAVAVVSDDTVDGVEHGSVHTTTIGMTEDQWRETFKRLGTGN